MSPALPHLLRRLVRSPLFTAMTLLTLAVGIGANTAIFSVVYSVLLKPLPYPEADRLVAIWQTAPGLNIKELNASPATTFTYREENRTFVDVGMWSRGSVSVTGVAEPEQVPALYTNDATLPLLGVQPAFGRWFTRQDDQPKSPKTVLLTHGYWQRRFGGDQGILGRRLLLDGEAHEVIGVMPERFHFRNLTPSLILPLQIDRNDTFVGNFSYQALARLKPGVTIDQANADVARMLPMMTRKFKLAPGMNLKMIEELRMGPSVRPLSEDTIGDVGKVLWVVMGTVGIVMLIACANVANLLLVRAEGRRQELAIRAALGANWGQIARELLTESAALGLLGGVLGLGVAYGALRLLLWLAPIGLPRIAEIRLDGIGLLFTALLSLLAGLAFGSIPVLKYAAPHVSAVLRSGGRTASAGRERHRTRNTLVVVQVALALILLISAGLMLRTLVAMQHVAPGFTDGEHILTLRVSIPEAEVRAKERVPQLFAEMLQRVSALPGVTSAAAVNSITMDGNQNNDPIFAEDHTYAESTIPPIRRYKHVTPGVFQTMGNPLLAGRDMTWDDIYQHRAVVLISESLARELWGSVGAAVGKRVRESPKGTWREVVGVVGNERDNGVDKPSEPIVYWPMAVANMWGEPLLIRRTMAFAIRSPRAGTSAFLREVQQAIWAVDRNLPLADVRTVDEIYRRSMARTSFTLVMLFLAAAMALLLGVIGIYGVIAYTVSQRTREIGIRMALGAQHGAVQRLFVRQGLVLAAIGVLCGLAAAIPLARVMTALLFEVSPLDPVTYGAVPFVLLAAALLAAWLPSWRATRIEPVEALRTE